MLALQRLLFFLLLFSAHGSLALSLNERIPYYPDSFYQATQVQAQSNSLKELIHFILSNVHIPQPQAQDRVARTCPPNQEDECYHHELLSYSDARRELFGRLHLSQTGGEYSLSCVYCDETYTNEDFPKGRGIGPGRIPDPSIFNAEHTWPQSKFNKRQPIDLQRSDLHILFPAKADANRLRSNFPFGEIAQQLEKVCAASAKGRDRQGLTVYEPPSFHKGNAARALFYFSIRYQAPIPDQDEAVLRKWHEEDPVDQDESKRQEGIFEVQKTRNPFIDYPELVDQIQNF